jgi:hypothetical protein
LLQNLPLQSQTPHPQRKKQASKKRALLERKDVKLEEEGQLNRTEKTMMTTTLVIQDYATKTAYKRMTTEISRWQRI